MNKNNYEAIIVSEIGKKYRIGIEKKSNTGIKSKIINNITAPFNWLKSQVVEPSEEEFLWALRNVSFKINQGEVVGFLGHNGAGKSTLLKILSRITEPSEGYAKINGRLSALLEVGTGMHPELTGKENIYLNGTILGMKKWEIDKKYSDIVEFSGISKFLNTPVKHYSSGMRVRLGFGIAAHLEPEILIVDEVLAVGDAEFQKKSIGKMKDVAKCGRTVLFVSHNMAAIKNLCPRSCLMHNGNLIYDGKTDDVIRAYYNSDGSNVHKSIIERDDRKGNGRIKFTDIKIKNIDGDVIDKIQSGEEVDIAVEYIVNDIRIKNNLDIHITFYSVDGKYMFTCSTEANGYQCQTYPSEGRIICKIRKFPLTSGSYSITLYSKYKGEVADWIVNTTTLTVFDGDFYGTGKLSSHKEGFLVEHEWDMESRI